MMATRLPALHNIATRLRIDSVRSTSEAGSGHPTSCCSAAELVAATFFAEMRYDPQHPENPDNDRFVLSKGHAAPILYAAWAEAGIISRDDLLTLRRFDSDLEGHPTPRLPWVDVATGSLGQGLCAGIGIALNARRISSDYRTYVLLGDGETAEGSVWEAANAAAFFALDSLCAIIDVNGLGQSRGTQLDHDIAAYVGRWRAASWHVVAIDGHDLTQVLAALDEARATKGRPTMIVARTIKGKGISFVEGKPGWHGKAFKKGQELDAVLAELRSQFVEETEPIAPSAPRTVSRAPVRRGTLTPPASARGDSVATREAYGAAIARLGAVDDRIVALDGDVGNSTFSEKFEQKFPDRFYQCFIAEQVMIGAAMGLAARGA
ncbi:MAG TPA: transketolase, partial [Vicinamibacterales bacterium]